MTEKVEHDFWELGLMPWAAMREAVTIGRFTIAPWAEHSEPIELPALSEQVSRAISRYRTDKRTAEDSAAVIVRVEGELLPFTEAEKAEIRHAVNILAFAYFIGNWGPLARTAENFEYVFLHVPKQPASEGSAYGAGSLLRVDVIVSAGVEKVFYAPEYVHIPMASLPDCTTLGLLSEAYLGLADPRLRASLMRSLEFVRLAYANHPTFAEATRIVLLCTAFESLLLTKKDQGKKAVKLACHVDRLLGGQRFRGRLTRKRTRNTGGGCATCTDCATPSSTETRSTRESSFT
jgi:hypothetical protein